VQCRGVMPVAKFLADLLERRTGELPRNVHGDLTGKDVGMPVSAITAC